MLKKFIYLLLTLGFVAPQLVSAHHRHFYIRDIDKNEKNSYQLAVTGHVFLKSHSISSNYPVAEIVLPAATRDSKNLSGKITIIKDNDPAQNCTLKYYGVLECHGGCSEGGCACVHPIWNPIYLHSVVNSGSFVCKLKHTHGNKHAHEVEIG